MSRFLTGVVLCALVLAVAADNHGGDDDLDGLLEGANNGGDKCFQKAQDISMGKCGTVSMKYGMCAASEAEATEGWSFATGLLTIAGAFITDDLCNEEIKTTCEGMGLTVKASGCDAYCDNLKAEVEGGMAADSCSSDSDCPMTTASMMCCDSTVEMMANLCEMTDDQKTAAKTTLMSANACSDTNCYSAAGQLMTSIVTAIVFTVGALILQK